MKKDKETSRKSYLWSSEYSNK